MYCKIIRSKQAGRMSDVLLFISWAGLVPVTVQAAALSVERVEVEINPLCVVFSHGFTQLKDVMDDYICCRKESELYTLLWVFGFPLYLYPSLRDEVVCADRDPFAAVPETKLMVGQRKQKPSVGLFWWQSHVFGMAVAVQLPRLQAMLLFLQRFCLEWGIWE